MGKIDYDSPRWNATVQIYQGIAYRPLLGYRGSQKGMQNGDGGGLLKVNFPQFKNFSGFGPTLRRWTGCFFFLFLSPELLDPLCGHRIQTNTVVLKFFLVRTSFFHFKVTLACVGQPIIFNGKTSTFLFFYFLLEYSCFYLFIYFLIGVQLLFYFSNT